MSHSNTGRSKKRVRFEDDPLLDNRIYTDKDGTDHPVYLDQLQLHVKKERGTEIQVGVTCNTNFMLANVREIGCSIRSKYTSVPFNTPIYLVLDNTGGHGTSDCKKRFMRILHRKYNVLCVWQVPLGI